MEESPTAEVYPPSCASTPHAAIISKIPDVFHLQLAKDEPVMALICTDGLTDVMSIPECTSILSSSTPESTSGLEEWNVQDLESTLNRHFQADNTTALLIPLLL